MVEHLTPSLQASTQHASLIYIHYCTPRRHNGGGSYYKHLLDPGSPIIKICTKSQSPIFFTGLVPLRDPHQRLPTLGLAESKTPVPDRTSFASTTAIPFLAPVHQGYALVVTVSRMRERKTQTCTSKHKKKHFALTICLSVLSEPALVPRCCEDTLLHANFQTQVNPFTNV